VIADDPVGAFEALPRRPFLDSSTLQTVLQYGGFIFENVEPPTSARGLHVPGFRDELEALRGILQVNQRAMLDVALSENSLREVADKQDPAYMSWALDVLDHWRTRIAERQGRAFSGRGVDPSRLDTVGYLSKKDRILLKDALAFECDAFLTMDRKLAKNAAPLRAAVGIYVLRPVDYWASLQPWAALYL
jgi:hypothetical protein